jgi:hypothetical protein
MIDDRSKLLLKALVERYIADGQPVGSRTLSKASGLELSPATIRNVMSDLEELGLIVSPHTSAGRIPTPRGYRFFVDSFAAGRPASGCCSLLGFLILGLVLVQVHRLGVRIKEGSCSTAAHVPAAGFKVEN